MSDPDIAGNPVVVPLRSFWQRRLVDPIVAQLTQGLTPDKIALTMAVGSSIAMFPIPGTTALFCLIVGVYMKLNQPIMQAVNLACTPIHIPFIYFAFKWGERFFGVPHPLWELHGMRRELIEHPLQFVQHYGLAALHAIGVWAIFVPVWAIAVYYVSRPVVRGLEHARLAAAAKIAAGKARDHPIP